MKRIIILMVFLLSFNGLANAGVVELTFHSRANCVGFNETVSWHLGHSYSFRTVSHHCDAYERNCHDVDTGWNVTWRSAAYHFPEGRSGGWLVRGRHYMRDRYNQPYFPEFTTADDCDIYDGWWDH